MNASSFRTGYTPQPASFRCPAFDKDAIMSIAPADVVFVSVAQLGRTLLDSAAFTNKSSVDEILSDVRALLSGVSGLVKVTLRNRSCGRLVSLSMRLHRPSMSILACA